MGALIFFCVVLMAIAVVTAIYAHGRKANKRQELIERAVVWRSSLGQELDTLRNGVEAFKKALCTNTLPTSAMVTPYRILDDIRQYLRAVDEEDIPNLDAWLQSFRGMRSVRYMQQSLDECLDNYSVHFKSIEAAKQEIGDATLTLAAQRQHYSADAANTRIDTAQSHAYALVTIITHYGQIQYLPEDLRMLRGQLLRELSVTAESATYCKEWKHVALDDFETRVKALHEACHQFLQAGVGTTYPRLPWLRGVDLNVSRQLSSYPTSRALVGVSYN